MKDKSKTLTQARLKEQLAYDDDTGLFTWRVSATNSLSPGDVAGSPNGRGYHYIGLDGCKHRPASLAWLFITGKFPKANYRVVQIDGDTNNRTNLALVKVKAHTNDISPFILGLKYLEDIGGDIGHNMWASYLDVTVDNTTYSKFLGLYHVPMEASAAREGVKHFIGGAHSE